MPQPYNPSAWYWIVAGSETQVYSSAACAYVPVEDESFTAWMEAGGMPTAIAEEADLEAVLSAQYPAGWPGLALKASAKALLDAADLTMLRVAEAVALATNSWASDDVVAWVEYRRGLRAVIAGTASELPAKPAYPAGT